MNDVNQITICKSDHPKDGEFENAVKDAIMVLLNNNYIMTVKYDANDKHMGIVSIDFEYADEGYGCIYPYWLSPEQADRLILDEASRVTDQDREDNGL